MAHKNSGLVCPKCFSGRTQKRGKRSLYCRDCDKFSSIENSLLVSFPQMTVQQKKYFKEPEAPKVLVFDIETLPVIGTFWGTGKEYISYKNILEDFVVLSWSAKWLYDDKVMGDILTPEEAQKRLAHVFLPEKEKKKNPHNADFRILQRIWKLLDEAEVVITQNGIKFDTRKLNTRFLYYRMPPTRPYQHIDTLKAAYEVLYPTSAKLDYMTKWLGLPNKLPTDYDLWLGCMQGDKESLDKMNEYGLNDTWILEQYYTEIRAWIPRHPNMSAWENRYVSLDEGEHSCPVCRSPIAETSLTGKPYRTPTGYRFQSFRCGNCGAVGRKTKRIGGQSIQVQRAG